MVGRKIGAYCRSPFGCASFMHDAIVGFSMFVNSCHTEGITFFEAKSLEYVNLTVLRLEGYGMCVMISVLINVEGSKCIICMIVSKSSRNSVASCYCNEVGQTNDGVEMDQGFDTSTTLIDIRLHNPHPSVGTWRITNRREPGHHGAREFHAMVLDREKEEDSCCMETTETWEVRSIVNKNTVTTGS